MKETIKWAFIILIAFLIEILVFKHTRFYNVTPNIVICLLVTLYYNKKNNFSITLTIIAGFIEFALMGTVSSLIAYCLFIPIIKYTYYYFQRNCFFYLVNLTIYTLIYEIFMFLWNIKANNFIFSYKQIIVQLIFNLIIGIIVYCIFELFNINKKEVEYL